MAIVAIAFSARVCPAAIQYTGVNVAGAEFGPTPTPGNLGTYGQNAQYFYPTAAEVDYYVGKGLNTFRMPFRWERLQPTAGGEFDPTELGRFQTFVSYATSKGANVIIEPHNFQRYYPDPNSFQTSAQGLVGSAVSDATYADFWGRLGKLYKDNYRVIFNLMNEPNSLPTEQLVTSSNAAIQAIRNAGANNLVLVPGNQWTGAWAWVLPSDGDNNPGLPGKQSWYGTVNADAMLNIVDPANNFAFDVHQYLDSDSSGGSSSIVNANIGQQRLVDFTTWAHNNGKRGFLGEFAVANSTIGAGIGDEAVNNMLNYMQSNQDVWMGWTWWAGGPKWGNYMFTLDPTNVGLPSQGADRAAMGVLQTHLAAIAPPKPGDYNNNGIYDAADYTLWQDSFGRSGPGLVADGNQDGIVDELDYELWRSNFGTLGPASGSGGVAPAGVPEPSTAVLLILGATMIFVCAANAR